MPPWLASALISIFSAVGAALPAWLAPHAAESLYAAGGGDRLVGTVEYSDYPPKAKKVARVGGYSRVDLEAVAALKPDLVIAWQSGNNMTQIDKLKALGLPVYVFQPNQMEDVPANSNALANSPAGCRQCGGHTFANDWPLHAANANKPGRVFARSNPVDDRWRTAVISDAITLCGGENVFGQIKQMAPTVNVEAVLEANPEAIVATGMGDARPEWLADWDKWTQMTAVKRGNMFHINPDIMQRHTPRILDGAEQLCAHLDVARSHRPAK
jgi:iron complex transport system substrate-binding protein